MYTYRFSLAVKRNLFMYEFTLIQALFCVFFSVPQGIFLFNVKKCGAQAWRSSGFIFVTSRMYGFEVTAISLNTTQGGGLSHNTEQGWINKFYVCTQIAVQRMSEWNECAYTHFCLFVCFTAVEPRISLYDVSGSITAAFAKKPDTTHLTILSAGLSSFLSFLPLP